jgi:subtilisin family serine protease
MAIVDTRHLRLKLVREPEELQYDPRLHEERLRATVRQAHTRRITDTIKGKCHVDVFAKLNNPGDSVVGFEIMGREDGEPDPRRIVTGRVDIEKIEEVRGQVKSLKAAAGVHCCLFHSVRAIHARREELRDTLRAGSFKAKRGRSNSELDGSGVIVGVVDIGCDFRHKNFRLGNESRILFLWDQSAEFGGRVPKEFPYGREFTKENIEAALRSGEDVAYKTLKYTPPIAAHGTHVLDIAAGNGQEPADFDGKKGPVAAPQSHSGVAPKVEIIFVHLKTFEDGALGNSRHLAEAVEYIFRKADELDMPAVVNISLSTTGGPHDGSSLVEQRFDELLEKPGRAIVVAAGNSFNQRSHTSGAIPAGCDTTILWHTDPRNTDPELTKNEMDIWYSGSQELQVTLGTPDEREVGALRLGETKDLYDDTKRYGRVSHRKDDPNNQDNEIELRLPHLENVAGAWRIKLYNPGSRPVPFHAWIEQDGRGLSRFEEPTDRRFTLGSISCSRKALTVGAFDTAEQASLAPPFEGTSAGPTRPSQRGKIASQSKPELSAPGVGIVAARAHGGVTVMSGTSMAAAHVTGVVALLFDLALRRGDDRLPIDLTRAVLTKAAGERSLDFQLAPGADPVNRERLERLGTGSIDAADVIKAFLESENHRPEEPNLSPEGVGPAANIPRDIESRLEQMSRQLSSMEKEMSRQRKQIARMIADVAQQNAVPSSYLLHDEAAKGSDSHKGYGPNGKGNGAKGLRNPSGSRPPK